MNVYDASISRRTVRKYENKPVKKEDLIKLIESARLAPSSANLQSLKYAVVTKEEIRKEIFPYLKYAGYIPSWNPEFLETATAFIIILNDTSIRSSDKSECDAGIAMGTISLVAEEMGLGTCCIGSADRKKVRQILGYDERFYVMYIMAVGHPAQTGEFFDDDTTVKYYFNEDGNTRVPKRSLKEVIIKYE